MQIDETPERFYSLADFKNWTKNDQVWLPDPSNGKSSLKEKSEIWIRHPERRQFKNIVFKPGVKVEPDIYNFWRGFNVAPKKGKWDLMQKHMKNVLCGGNAEHFDFLLKWCAAIVRHCMDSENIRRPEVAVVLKGERGIGKDCFCNCFGEIFGRHYRAISQKDQLVGKFNDHFKDCVLCHAPETFWAGDKQAEGNIKHMITSPTVTIEPKHKNPYEVESHISLVISSNEDWVIPAGPKERRFFVPTMANTNPVNKDPDYFYKIRNQWKNGGAAAMLYDLMRFEYSERDFTKPPVTDELKHQAQRSASPHEQFWFECLAENIDLPWGDFVSSDTFYQKYQGFCDDIGQKRRLSKKILIREILKIIELKKDRPYIGGIRQRGVNLTDIETARRATDAYFGY
jgi:phage/plasmid-associated DNA primase